MWGANCVWTKHAEETRSYKLILLKLSRTNSIMLYLPSFWNEFSSSGKPTFAGTYEFVHHKAVELKMYQMLYLNIALVFSRKYILFYQHDLYVKPTPFGTWYPPITKSSVKTRVVPVVRGKILKCERSWSISYYTSNTIKPKPKGTHRTVASSSFVTRRV